MRGAQECGCSLKEIRELLSLRVSRRRSSGDIRTRAEGKIVDIEAKIRRLESMKKTLRKLTRVCDGCAPVAECPILESLDRETHEQQVEAKHLGSPEHRRIGPAQIGLSGVLASLCRLVSAF